MGSGHFDVLKIGSKLFATATARKINYFTIWYAMATSADYFSDAIIRSLLATLSRYDLIFSQLHFSRRSIE